MKEIKNESKPNIKSQSCVNLNHQEITKAYEKGELWTARNDSPQQKESYKETIWFKGSRSRGIVIKSRDNLAA